MKPVVNIVMVCLLFTATAAGGAIPASHPQSTISDDDYRSCIMSDECVSFSVPCSAPIAINSRYRAVVESWYDYMNTHISCSLQHPDTYSTPVCRNGRCILSP